MCVDYRRLKSKTIVNAYQIPRISELVDQLGGATYISMLDLKKILAGSYGRRGSMQISFCYTFWP